MNETETSSPGGTRLSLWDTISIIIGIVVGVSIFRAPPMVFANVSGPWAGLAAWGLGGLLSLIGALCFAELATAYPRSGGMYVYLSKAFGPWLGFLFGWTALTVIGAASIGAMAFVFADYAKPIIWRVLVLLSRDHAWHDDMHWFYLTRYPDFGPAAFVASASIALPLSFNLFGLTGGKFLQNVLTLLKLIGLSTIILSAVILVLQGQTGHWTVSPGAPTSTNFGLAMIFVLYAFGGWNDAAYIATEIDRPQRNIPRALFYGIGLITLIYILVNIAFIWILGPDLTRTRIPASDILSKLIGNQSGIVMNAIVMASALGAISGMILTGSRLYATMGEDHRLFSLLSRWHPRLKSPVWSLLAQSGFAILWIFAVGTKWGRIAIDGIGNSLGLGSLPWSNFGGGFDTLVTVSAPVFWAFFLLVGVALIVLRVTDPRPRPFRVPLYPWIPLIFCATCAYMLYSAVAYAGWLSLLGLLPVAAGVPLYGLSRFWERKAGAKAENGKRTAD